MKLSKRLVLIVCILGAIGYAYWKLVIPTHRVEVSSELVMLGDLDDDHRWTRADLTRSSRPVVQTRDAGPP